MTRHENKSKVLSVGSTFFVFLFLLARIKRTDLGKAKTVVGTCPDMCPEKERYMRETRNQLSVFELLLGSDKVQALCIQGLFPEGLFALLFM